MTKKLALVLAILMVLGLCLTACKSDEASTDDTATQAPATQAPAATEAATAAPVEVTEVPNTTGDANFNPSGFPCCVEKEELEVLTSRSTYAPEDLNELYIVQQAEAITNVHVNFESYTGTTYTEKYNIILASGDYPEVISVGMTALLQAQYGMQEGIFIKQNDLVDTYMTELQRLFDEKPALRAYVTSADGELYSLPTLNEGGWMQAGNMMIVNASWLDDLGMDMPTTLADFRTMLEAFRDNDCNGNGNASDEIPLGVLSNLVGYNSGNTGLQHFFAAFGITMNSSYIDADDSGTVYYTGTDDRYKAALKYFRDLAADGLLGTDDFAGTWDTFHPKFNQEPYTYGCHGIWEIGDGFTSPNGPIQYDFLTPIMQEDGSDPVFYINPYPGYSTGKWVLTVDCEKPYLAARYGDYFYQKDVSLTCIEGAIDGPNPRLIPCTVCNNGRALMVSTDVPEGMTILMFRDMNFASFYPWGVTREYYDERLHLHFTDRKVNQIDNVLKQYADPTVVPGTLMYTVDEATVVNQIYADLRDYTNRRAVEWVMGQGDIDADWDAYKAELQAMRVDEYVACAQAAYDRFLDVMSQY